MDIHTLKSSVHLSVTVEGVDIQKLLLLPKCGPIKPMDIICEYSMYHARMLYSITTKEGVHVHT